MKTINTSTVIIYNPLFNLFKWQQLFLVTYNKEQLQYISQHFLPVFLFLLGSLHDGAALCHDSWERKEGGKNETCLLVDYILVM